MIIPLSPILAKEFGADSLQVGFLISLYSIAQFFFAPLWGRLSDIFGRKPIILLGLLGVACSHIWFAFSTTLTALFLSRFLAGFFGGNITTAMACIADVTGRAERSKNMGLIGMAFGLGFVAGPALGGVFVLWGHQLGSAPPFGASFSALGAGIISFINCFTAALILKETLQFKKRPASYLSAFKKSSVFSRSSPLKVWHSLTAPGLGSVLFMSFVLWLALAQIEPTLILLVQDDFSWEKVSAYWGFTYIGLLMALTQGVLVRRWIPRFGERRVNQWGLLLVSMGLIFMGASAGWAGNSGFPVGLSLLSLGVTLFALGYSLANTSLSGAVSLLSPAKEQGHIFGVNQSLASLARVIGPILGGWLYRDLSHGSPFLLSGLMAFGIFLLAFRIKASFPDTGHTGRSDGKKSPADQRNENPALYSIDGTQLGRLLEKRISFRFFYLSSKGESFSPSVSSHRGHGLFLGPESLLERAEVKTPEEIRSLLKKIPKETPLVFICKDGTASMKFSMEVQEKGWQNAYYVEGGQNALKKNP